MGLLAAEQVLGSREIGQPEPLELGGRVLLGLAQLGFHLGSPAQSALDLALGHLLLLAEVLRGLSGAEGDQAEDEPDDGDADPDRAQDRQAIDELAGHAEADPEEDDDERRQGDRAPGRRRRVDLVVDLDLARQHRPELDGLRLERAQPLDGLADHRQRVRGRMGVAEPGQLGRGGDRLGVARLAVDRRCMLRRQQLGAARLLEQRPAGLEVRAGRRAGVGRGPERGAIGDQPRERRLPGRQGRLGSGDGLLGDAEPARIPFAPRVELGQDATQLLDGLGRAPVGRADRDRETLAEGGLVAIEVLQLAMADEGRRAEERRCRDAGEVGQPGIDVGGIGGRDPVDGQGGRPAGTERLLDRAGPIRPSGGPGVDAEVQGDRRSGGFVGIPRPQAVEPAGGPRIGPGHDRAGQAELDRPGDRRLARLVRAPDDRQPGSQVDLQVAIALDVAELESRDPHGDRGRRHRPTTEAEGLAQLGGGRLAPGLLGLRDARLEVAQERAGDRVGRRQRLGARHRPRQVPDPDPQEPIGQRRLGVLRIDLDLVRPVADETRVKDEVRIGSGGQRLDEPGLVDEAGQVELDPFEPRLADPLALDRGLGRVVEGHDQRLAGRVAFDVDELGCAAGPPADGRRSTRRGRVRAAEREIVDPGGRDLVVARARLAVDDADPPAVVGQPAGREPGAHAGAQRRDDHVLRVVGQDRQRAGRRPVADDAGQVVGRVDRGPAGRVGSARDEDDRDAGRDDGLQHGRDTLDQGPRLDARVEQVAGDQEEIGGRGQDELADLLERRELAFPLLARRVAQERVARTEVNVGRLDETEHRRSGPPGPHWRVRCERGAPLTLARRPESRAAL